MRCFQPWMHILLHVRIQFIRGSYVKRIVGRSPFVGRMLQDVYECNRKCEISFDHPRIKMLSSEGEF